MKKIIYIPAYFILLFLSTALSYSLLDHYEVTTGHKIAFKSADPSGSFAKISGSIDFDETEISTCKFVLNIPVSSISTGNALRDKKAQTAEWFNAKTYPEIKFVSSAVSKSGDTYNIKGNLTMKGITKLVTIPATLSKSGNKITFNSSFTVDRIKFGVGKKSDVVPDNMAISVVLPAIKK